MTPRIYVACRQCREAGRIVGAWFDAVDAPQTPANFDWAVLGPGPEASEHLHWDHDRVTLVVLDHQGFGGRLQGETTVERAREIAREIEEGDSDGDG